MTNESKKTPTQSNLPADQLRTPSGSVSAAGRMGVPAADTGHNPQDLDTLRKIAQQATPGPWEARQSGNFPGKYVVGPRHRPGDIGRGPIVLMQPIFLDEGSVVNAEFIAAFDPETVLALITRTEQAEAAVARVREALSNHPRTCDQHTEDDPVKCGWKRAVIDVQNILDGDGRG